MLHVSATPPRPGAKVVLQAYDREHFAWRPVGRPSRLDRASRATLSIPVGIERVRAVVLGERGWADAAAPGARSGAGAHAGHGG